LVSCSKANELETVREKFLKVKFGLSLSDEEIDVKIQEVCQAVFYTMLVEKFAKQEVYA